MSSAIATAAAVARSPCTLESIARLHLLSMIGDLDFGGLNTVIRQMIQNANHEQLNDLCRLIASEHDRCIAQRENVKNVEKTDENVEKTEENVEKTEEKVEKKEKNVEKKEKKTKKVDVFQQPGNNSTLRESWADQVDDKEKEGECAISVNSYATVAAKLPIVRLMSENHKKEEKHPESDPCENSGSSDESDSHEDSHEDSETESDESDSRRRLCKFDPNCMNPNCTFGHRSDVPLCKGGNLCKKYAQGRGQGPRRCRFRHIREEGDKKISICGHQRNGVCHRFALGTCNFEHGCGFKNCNNPDCSLLHMRFDEDGEIVYYWHDGYDGNGEIEIVVHDFDQALRDAREWEEEQKKEKETKKGKFQKKH